MKKLITLLTLTFILIMGTSIASNAEELNEERKGRVVTQKVDREAKTAELEAKKDELEDKRFQQQEKHLGMLTELAPDWVASYTSAFAEHNSVHVLLEEATTLMRDAIIAENQANGQALKADIKAQVEAGDITQEEARALLVASRETVIAANKAIRSEFKAEVETIKSSLGLSEETATALRTDLKAAIEAEDGVAIDLAVSALYDYLLTHIEFDYQKLELINSQTTVEL